MNREKEQTQDIRYLGPSEGIKSEDLTGFFQGWPKPPTQETHLRLLTNSDEAVLAVEKPTVVTPSKPVAAVNLAE